MTDSLLQEGRNEGWNLNEDLRSALVKSPDKALRYDTVSATTAYLGIAVVGSGTAAAVWQVKRLTFGTDGDVTVEFADGNNLFDNVWDDRVSLSYS